MHVYALALSLTFILGKITTYVSANPVISTQSVGPITEQEVTGDRSHQIVSVSKRVDPAPVIKPILENPAPMIKPIIQKPATEPTTLEQTSNRPPQLKTLLNVGNPFEAKALDTVKTDEDDVDLRGEWRSGCKVAKRIVDAPTTAHGDLCEKTLQLSLLVPNLVQVFERMKQAFLFETIDSITVYVWGHYSFGKLRNSATPLAVPIVWISFAEGTTEKQTKLFWEAARNIWNGNEILRILRLNVQTFAPEMEEFVNTHPGEEVVVTGSGPIDKVVVKHGTPIRQLASIMRYMTEDFRLYNKVMKTHQQAGAVYLELLTKGGQLLEYEDFEPILKLQVATQVEIDEIMYYSPRIVMQGKTSQGLKTWPADRGFGKAILDKAFTPKGPVAHFKQDC